MKRLTVVRSELVSPCDARFIDSTSFISLGTARPILRWGTPVLHTPTRPVTDFGAELQELLADIFATNTAAEGAGLAAPQIGVDLAVFVYDCTDETGTRRTGVV